MCEELIEEAQYNIKRVRDILELMADNTDRLKADILMMQVAELDEVSRLLGMGQMESASEILA